MIPTAEAYIKSNEGLRLYTYDDKTGKRINAGDAVVGTLTAGYGHTGPDVIAGMVVTVDMAEIWFQRNFAAALRGSIAALGTGPWMELDQPRRCALTDICYELGEYGVAQFHRMLSAVRGLNWPVAADELMASKYAVQVPNRAERNRQILLTGIMPDLA